MVHRFPRIGTPSHVVLSKVIVQPYAEESSIMWSLLPIYHGNVHMKQKTIEWMQPCLKQLKALRKEALSGGVIIILLRLYTTLICHYREHGGTAKVEILLPLLYLKARWDCHSKWTKNMKWCGPDLNSLCYHQPFANNTNLQEYQWLH